MNRQLKEHLEREHRELQRRYEREIVYRTPNNIPPPTGEQLYGQTTTATRDEYIEDALRYQTAAFATAYTTTHYGTNIPITDSPITMSNPRSRYERLSHKNYSLQNPLTINNPLRHKDAEVGDVVYTNFSNATSHPEIGIITEKGAEYAHFSGTFGLVVRRDYLQFDDQPLHLLRKHIEFPDSLNTRYEIQNDHLSSYSGKVILFSRDGSNWDLYEPDGVDGEFLYLKNGRRYLAHRFSFYAFDTEAHAQEALALAQAQEAIRAAKEKEREELIKNFPLKQGDYFSVKLNREFGELERHFIGSDTLRTMQVSMQDTWKVVGINLGDEITIVADCADNTRSDYEFKYDPRFFTKITKDEATTRVKNVIFRKLHRSMIQETFKEGESKKASSENYYALFLQNQRKALDLFQKAQEDEEKGLDHDTLGKLVDESLESIKKDKRIKDVRFDPSSPTTIVVETNPLSLRDVVMARDKERSILKKESVGKNLGSFTILLYLTNGGVNIKRSGGARGFHGTHPHVFSDGRLCKGNMSAPLTDAIIKLDLRTAVEIILAILEVIREGDCASSFHEFWPSSSKHLNREDTNIIGTINIQGATTTGLRLSSSGATGTAGSIF